MLFYELCYTVAKQGVFLYILINYSDKFTLFMSNPLLSVICLLQISASRQPVSKTIY